MQRLRRATLFPYTTLFRSEWQRALKRGALARIDLAFSRDRGHRVYVQQRIAEAGAQLYDWLEKGAYVYVCGDAARDRKSTRLNSSHLGISYAVFGLKKKRT